MTRLRINLEDNICEFGPWLRTTELDLQQYSLGVVYSARKRVPGRFKWCQLVPTTMMMIW